MPLPQDQNFSGTNTGQASGSPGQHPDGVFLFQGHKVTMVLGSGGGLGMAVTALNVFGKKHEGALVFCIEKALTQPSGQVTRTHRWKTEEAYTAEHTGLWREYDMEPNRDFDVGDGLRSEGGEHLGGSNELCQRDGGLKMEAIRLHCS